MELSNKQLQLLDTPSGLNTLIEGYSGVGKSTVLLKKYEGVSKAISRNDSVLIVSDILKKQMMISQYAKISNKYNSLNILTINELIYRYLKRINLPLFQNTIDKKRKKELITEIVNNYADNNFDFTLDYIVSEINFIQANICIKDKEGIDFNQSNELKVYLGIPRRSVKKGLLSFREKEYIFKIYQLYLNQVLNNDIFDEETFYQSFLRLIYHQADNNELAMTFAIILIDDIHDFTKVQLDIIYYLYDQSKDGHFSMMSLDELKSHDRHKNFRNSLLYKCINNSVTLDINYRNSRNVFNIIKSNLSNNDLFRPTLQYKSAYNNNKNENRSVMTYFYNKSQNEKREVFFDRLDLLINIMNYRLSDILVVFFDEKNLKSIRDECLLNNIKVIDIYDHLERLDLEALTFIYKEELVNCEFKVVILYDADNRKLCTGPINKIININNNYEDTINFYISLTCAKDFLIINSSISEPSHLLLPSRIDYSQFVFEVGSKFQIKSTLNVYRITDFISWIKENLSKQYEYTQFDYSTHSVFDLYIDLNYQKVGFKILDNDMDSASIKDILEKGIELTYLVIFDNHHYITFKNVKGEYVRVIDIPNR